MIEGFERLVRRIVPQAKLLRTWQLEGGVSAQVTALEVAMPWGATQKWVVRRHGPRDLASNPQVAMHEFRLLLQLHTAGLPVPAPVFVDVSEEILPNPYIVIQFIEGEQVLAPADLTGYLRQAAERLAAVHRLDLTRSDLDFLPELYIDFEPLPEALPPAAEPDINFARIRHTLKTHWPHLVFNDPTLLHGDYWPGNLLWREGNLVAILDWEDACTGDPLADLANTRLEILWAFGEDAMHTLTRSYRDLMSVDYTNLAFWDLWAAHKAGLRISNWGLEAAEGAKMFADLYSFAAQALSEVEKMF